MSTERSDMETLLYTMCLSSVALQFIDKKLYPTSIVEYNSTEAADTALLPTTP